MKLRESIRRFFRGRYGPDDLFIFMTACYILVSIANFILGLFIADSTVGLIIYYILGALSWALIIFSVWRVFSRKIQKRITENAKFLNVWRRIFKKDPFFSGKASGVRLAGDNDSAIFRRCLWCGVALRLPNRRGKHQVRCPRCGRMFDINV